MCFFLKIFFSKKSVCFILFNVSRSNISLVFFYVSVTSICLIFFLFINENYLSLDFCINDEYVLCFFQYFSVTNFCHVLFFEHIYKEKYFFHFLLYQEQILVLNFLCIDDKYLSRVFYIYQ